MASFRARARTVDMLGRQQIAGIPTAISELFKNAHDAYATRVEVDFFRQDKLLALRDDGLGMSPDDFVERWLTLGTESKVRSPRGLAPPPSMAGQQRPVLGEKGIGRLAIASIGSQVLVLTRPRAGKPRTLTAALVNWRLFELPGINLDQVEIPIFESPKGEVPDAAELTRMAERLRRSLKKFRLEADERKGIESDLKALEFDPRNLAEKLGAPKLTGRGHGAHFLVVPASAQLVAEIDPPEENDEGYAPPLIRALMGFANTMTPDAPKPVMTTAFRDHKAPDDCDDLIAAREFFTPAEFNAADHHIEGWFDEQGFFEGTVQVYGQVPERYALAYAGGDGGELECGPFRLRLAYVQGLERDTRLDLATYRGVSEKLKQIGGLYIYRDGIRVLPYGDPAFDFLNIEQRRSENIGRYFFSYRRMFGVIELASGRNDALREKAGREGFREGRAYREFRDVLKRFLKQVALDYFSSRGEHSEQFRVGRAEAQRRYEQRAAREAEAAKERERLERQVGKLTSALTDARPESEAAALTEDLTAQLSALRGSSQKTADRVLDLELWASDRLNELRANYRITAPTGYGLTPELRRNYEWLADRLEALEETVWSPTAAAIAEQAEATRKRLKASGDRQLRLVQLVEHLAEDAKRRAQEGAQDAREAASTASNRVDQASRDSLALIEEVTEAVLAAAQARQSMSDAAFVTRRARLERQLLDAGEKEENRLATLAARLRRASLLNGAGPAVSDAEAAALLEEEVLELRERVDRDFELAQLGMATQVITHELDVAIVEVRDALRRLAAWADINPRLSEVHRDLRSAFDHLDGYLSLFTPLQRRLRRRRERLTGAKIVPFLARLFGPRLESLGIELQATEKFTNWEAAGYRSVLYPVLINLVDNASYWVRQNKPPYWIRLDADGSDLIIVDSGPGIPERDHDVIWDYGFSRKPGGRGAGLHISREVLSREGWNVAAESPAKGDGATFRVSVPAEEG